MLQFCVLCVSSADIDDLKICYILKDEINATSDVFSFTVEDNGKENAIHFTRKWNVPIFMVWFVHLELFINTFSRITWGIIQHE